MSNSGWWGGTRLVAGRLMVETARSRTWRAVTALMLLVGLSVIVVPRLIGEDDTTYRLATVGSAPPGLVVMLEQAGSAGGFQVELREVSDEVAAVAAVRSGDVDAALTGISSTDSLYVDALGSNIFPALVSQAAVAQATTGALLDAGLDGQQVADIQAITAPQQVPVGRVADEVRAAVGFVAGFVLYVFLFIAGTTIAGAVATEKSSRISEVLLAVLRPTQLLVGTVVGAGTMIVVQITAILMPAAIGVMSGTVTWIPEMAGADLVLALAWVVLGLVLYAFVFAALGALVDKPSDVGSATLPSTIMVIASFLVAATVAMSNPNSALATVASFFPFSAVLVMPVRWASGLVPGWQLAVAMALTAAAAVGTALLASRIYARGMTRTGRRVRLREVLSD